MLSPQDVGARVSVRRALSMGRQTDVIGQLESWERGLLHVRRSDGEIVEIEESTVVAGRTIPPAPPRRPPGVPHVTVEEMQRIANAGWPARDTEALGDWLLRAHGGITGRANSVMVVGDPGLPLDDALRRVDEWYAERGLPALLQVPHHSAVNAELEHRGWHAQLERRGWHEVHVTIVQTAAVAPTIEALRDRTESVGARQLHSSVDARPNDRWLSLMHDLDRENPEDHIAILTAPEVVGFATVFDGDEPVGIGRVSIEGAWAGVTSVDIAPERRRQGIGHVVMRTLLEWAAAHGARAAYLQVRAKNEPALELYRRLGFVSHHAYCYRAQP